MGILEIIRKYDQEQGEYIAQLEEENQKLRAEKAEAINLAVRGSQIHEVSMLELITSGALIKPPATEGKG